MKNVAFNPKYLYTSDFGEVEPRKVAEIRKEYVPATLHFHSKPGRSTYKNKDEQLVVLINHFIQNKIRIAAITDHEKLNIDKGDKEITDQRFYQISELCERDDRYSSYEIKHDDSALTIKAGDTAVTLLKSKEFWAKNSAGKYAHILGIGYDGDIENNYKLSVSELMEEIKNHKGLIDFPHPFNIRMHGISEEDLEEQLGKGIRPDMIEGFNSANHPAFLFREFNRKAIEFGWAQDIPLVTGSDAHFPFQIDYGYILVPRKHLKTNIKNDLRGIIESGDYYNYARYVPLWSLWYALPGKKAIAKILQGN